MTMKGTTICAVKRGDQVAIAGDGQVTMGENTVFKSSAKKVRRLYEGKVIARGYNRRNVDKTTLAHAEIMAIKKASKVLGDWRLEDCTMYVTLEPCQMCAGAIVQARIPKVVIGCMNPKAGCAGSILNLLDMKQFNHQVEVTRGIMETECSAMMSGFFAELRAKKKAAALKENNGMS